MNHRTHCSCAANSNHYTYFERLSVFISHPYSFIQTECIISNSRHKSANVFSLQHKISNTKALDIYRSTLAYQSHPLHHSRSSHSALWNMRFDFHDILLFMLILYFLIPCDVCRFYPLEHYTFAYMRIACVCVHSVFAPTPPYHPLRIYIYI